MKLNEIKLSRFTFKLMIFFFRKFKINSDTKDWLLTQLEEELDTADDEIISNNIKLIDSFQCETYRIDIGLLNIIKKEVFLFLF